MKILITGGAGYIGSMLVNELIGMDHEVTVLDKFLYKQNSLASWCVYPELTIVRGDVRDSRVLEELLPKHDVVIPLAAIVGASACERDRVAAQTTNYDAINAMCFHLSDEQWVLYPNTNSGYGIGTNAPCTEQSPLEPISLYGRTKCDAERRVMERRNSISLRLATVFGVSPRMRTDLMVNDFVRRAYTDKSLTLYEPYARRNFIHVRDVCGAFVRCLDEFCAMRGNVYNAGDTSANMTKARLCHRIGEAVPGFEWLMGTGEDVDKRDYLVSNAKLEATGWRPMYTLKQGIEELLKYYVMSGGRVEGNV